MPGESLRPFTPRIIEIDYVSIPWGPEVFVSGLGCEPTYPFDPRNLSLYDTD